MKNYDFLVESIQKIIDLYIKSIDLEEEKKFKIDPNARKIQWDDLSLEDQKTLDAMFIYSQCWLSQHLGIDEIILVEWKGVPIYYEDPQKGIWTFFEYQDLKTSTNLKIKLN